MSEPPTTANRSRRDGTMTEVEARTHTVRAHGVDYRVRVRIPPSYATSVREKFDVVYVLDNDEGVAERAAILAAQNYEEIRKQEGRQWYPRLIMVCGEPVNNNSCCTKSTPPTAEQSMEALDAIMRLVDQAYTTKPYGAGRSLVAQSSIACEVVHLAMNRALGRKDPPFRFFALGTPSASGGVSDAAPAEKLEDKCAVLLSVNTGAGDSAISAARACKEVLDARVNASGPTTTVMKVDRHGDQHYSEEHGRGLPAVTLDIVEGSKDAFVERAMRWLGERVEMQKLASLGGLMPWHEFR